MAETWKLYPVEPHRVNCGTRFVVSCVSDDGGNVALVYGSMDARLIEQAPQMRHLLEEVAKWERYMGGFEGALWPAIRKVLGTIKLAEAFPDYPIETLPEIPADFEASHWKNDACPSWTRGDLRLFIDYPDEAHRDAGCGGTRFSLLREHSDGWDSIIESDNWSEIVEAIAALDGEG